MLAVAEAMSSPKEASTLSLSTSRALKRCEKHQHTLPHHIPCTRPPAAPPRRHPATPAASLQPPASRAWRSVAAARPQPALPAETSPHACFQPPPSSQRPARPGLEIIRVGSCNVRGANCYIALSTSISASISSGANVRRCCDTARSALPPQPRSCWPAKT